MKYTFLVWAPYHRRAELLAEHLGASVKYVYDRRTDRPLGTPLRYAVQSRQTWQALKTERPDAIFAQNPPIFCVLIASLYAQRYGVRYVIDSHSGAFTSPKWRWSLGIHHALSRRALLTIVHNDSQEQIVKDWGCRYLVIGFTPGSYPPGEDFALEGQFNVAVVSSFHEDEPVDKVFEAAARMPDVCFYVTGDATRLAQALLVKKPTNCHLTSYLSYERYVGLLRAVDAIMVLTTGEHTLLMGGFEAVSLGRPLIVSDWPVLRQYFSLGTVHIPNSVEGVCQGVSRARREKTVLQCEIITLREQLQVSWEKQLAALKRLLET